MTPLIKPLSRIVRGLESQRGLLALALAFAFASAIFLFFAARTEQHSIRISAGDGRSLRAQVAEGLATECRARGLRLEIVPSAGSEESLERVERGEIDAALIQGGLRAGPDVREVAPLTLEPLHLLVRNDRELYELEDLRGMRVNLSPPRSGTRQLAFEVLSLAGLSGEDDFEETSFGFRELEEMDREALPDALFHVSSLPSPLAEFLIHERGYRLLPLPYADAISLRNAAVSRGVIPAYAYGANPAVPRDDVPTLATRMVLITHRRTSDEVVKRLLEAIDSDRFMRTAHLSRSEQAALFQQPEFTLHRGAAAWLHRNDPLLTPEMMEGIESFRSFLVSLVVAAVLAYRWWRRRRLHGLDSFIAEVSQIDREVLESERNARLDLGKLIGLRTRLGEVKARALEAFQRGAIHSEELLSSFLTHVSDVRSHLNAMILHERDRREKAARAQGGTNEETFLRELWEDALDEEHADRELRVATKKK